MSTIESNPLRNASPRVSRRSTPCAGCGDEPTRLFRIKFTEGGPWVIACPICAARISENNPHFVYGGRISPRYKRASA